MADKNVPRSRHVPAFVKTYNRFVRSFAGRRLYALLRHSGRKSGKTYETPVMAWPTASGILVPISWGLQSDWYQNTIASGSCAIQIRGRWNRCAEPALISRAEALAHLPPLTRSIARLFPIQHFMLMRKAS